MKSKEIIYYVRYTPENLYEVVKHTITTETSNESKETAEAIALFLNNKLNKSNETSIQAISI